MKKQFNIIWIARGHDKKNTIIGVAETYEDISKLASLWSKKKGHPHNLETYAQVQEGEILCERSHCYKEHFNFCPHCGNKLNYREDNL